MKKLLFSLFGIVLTCHAFAQVKGRVIEINYVRDTTTVPGVILMWSNSSINTTTNENGYFIIPTTPVTNRLLIRATGYKADSVLAVSYTHLDVYKRQL